MKLTTVWLVRDPSEDSVIEDVLWETSMLGLFYNARGSLPGDWTLKHTEVYTTEAEARADAGNRLMLRDAMNDEPCPEVACSHGDDRCCQHCEPRQEGA